MLIHGLLLNPRSIPRNVFDRTKVFEGIQKH